MENLLSIHMRQETNKFSEKLKTLSLLLDKFFKTTLMSSIKLNIFHVIKTFWFFASTIGLAFEWKQFVYGLLPLRINNKECFITRRLFVRMSLLVQFEKYFLPVWQCGHRGYHTIVNRIFRNFYLLLKEKIIF